MSSPTITEAERGALYDLILDRLSGIGDVWLAASAGDYALADRLAREYRDELTLVVDALGWGEGRGVASVELAVSAELLRRVFRRLRDGVVTERAQRQDAWAESRALEERNRLVGQACDAVLAAIGDEGP